MDSSARPDNDIRTPTLSDFIFDVSLLFLWENDSVTSTTSFVFFVLLVILKGCMAFF